MGGPFKAEDGRWYSADRRYVWDEQQQRWIPVQRQSGATRRRLPHQTPWFWVIGGGVLLLLGVCTVAVARSPQQTPSASTVTGTSPRSTTDALVTPSPTATLTPPPTAAPTPIVAPAQPTPQPTTHEDYLAELRARGVSAICNDGTLSYSRNRSGTCSQHKGVREWTGLI